MLLAFTLFLCLLCAFLVSWCVNERNEAHYWEHRYDTSRRQYAELAREFDARWKIDRETRAQFRRIEAAVETVNKLPRCPSINQLGK